MSPLEGYGCSSEANTNLIKCLGGGGGEGSDSEEAEDQDHLVLVVGHQMADQEDDSRTTDQSVNEATTASTSLIKDATTHRHHHQQDRSSNIIIDKDDKWLQLSIGGLTASADNKHNLDIQPDNQSSTRGARPGMIELDLLPGSSSTNSEHELRLKSAIGLAPSPSMFHVPQFGAPSGPLPNIITSTGAASSSSSNYYTTNTSLFMQQYPSSFPSSYHHHHHGEIEFNWGAALRPVQRNIGSASTPLSSSSSRIVPTAGPYLSRPFQLQLQLQSGGLGVGAPRHSIDFRVVDPPGRPPAGIWFKLQASQNQ